MILEGKAGRLLVKAYETRGELGRAAAQEAAQALREVIAAKGGCNVIFAAAPSQNEFLDALCREDVAWDKVSAFHMDEYIGLTEEAPQRFGNFLKKAVFERVPFRRVEYIRGNALDIEAEIARYSALLSENPPDLVFMGIGENGHIAFNDPHAAHFDDEQTMRAVELDEVCRHQQVNDGCFRSLEQVPTHALTLTIPALVSAARLFCMVPGATKANAVGKTVLGEIREKLPASVLRMHPCAALYIDRDSGRDVLAAWGKIR